jgi:hypothetical protein
MPFMKRFWLSLLAVLLLAAPASAAYNTATVKTNEPNRDGTYRLVATFTGNAGEPAVDREITVSAGTTLTVLRQWAINIAAELNGTRTVATNAAVQPGQTVNLTPITPAAATAEAVWQEKARRLQRLKALGLTNSTAVTRINALEADVNATFVDGYEIRF